MYLLLLSNSTTEGFSYLEHANLEFANFLNDNIKSIAFIPYAGVTFSYDDYTHKVQHYFERFGIKINSVHLGDSIDIIKNSDAIAVGGGNTFQLLKSLYDNDLIEVIREEVKNGKKYIGWSAGSNIASPTIRTTNDMPIVQPYSFDALNLINYQINPHYLDAHPSGHHGETREQRLLEFLELNKDIYVVGLREGSMIRVDNCEHYLLGSKQARIFKYGQVTTEINPNSKLSF
ncbi:MAG TPA: dipeptidase PepE [Candidatus Kapabacteria bacterium]|nr:dipeptidase PepE [Candidatus Kapabacteria bacterium]